VPRGKKITDELKSEMVKMYNAGYSRREIAYRFSCSADGVSRTLKGLVDKSNRTQVRLLPGEHKVTR